jgi:hypothetical protein
MRFHAARSLMRGGWWSAMVRHPRKTWKHLVWHSAPFLGIEA